MAAAPPRRHKITKRSRLRSLEPQSGSHQYPRPLLCRSGWQSLNGRWEFAIDGDGVVEDPEAVDWQHVIEVPYAPETRASGVHDTSLFKACWYRRTISRPRLDPDQRLLLHFGAVDYRASVWVNGQRAVVHEGGYTPFSCDITPQATQRDTVEIVVRAEDDPGDLAKPRGKQDWLRDPHLIWYPRASGIWQTVWMEVVGARWISHLQWTPNLHRWEIGCAARVSGPSEDSLRLCVRLRAGSQVLADDQYLVVGGEVHRRIALSDPGIDDYRNTLLWNPASPTLIDADLQLRTADGHVLDAVTSYTALRSAAVEGDRFVLNGRPYQLRLVLDQGYWPETGQTAPGDDALRRDVELARAMGFNGVRKHQKIEDPRYLYWADRLGLLVWAEMPSAYRFTHDSIIRTTREWTAAVDRDYSHPCIVAWVPFNESWGVPNLPNNPAERHYVRALYHLTHTLDATRPVVGNDGWESVATDIIGIHDYDADPERLARRYHADEIEPRFFKRERPGGRLLLLDGERRSNEPVVLSEFGGIALAADRRETWGYSRAHSARELATQYGALLAAVRSIGLLSGFCYTQFADTYQEANGLLRADRTPKFPIEEIAAATRGSP
jgi:beta-galactosidase/beta-glucuronidase